MIKLIEKFSNFINKIESEERLGPCRNCIVRAICLDECKIKEKYDKVTDHGLFKATIVTISVITTVVLFIYFRKWFIVHYIISFVFGVFLILEDKDFNGWESLPAYIIIIFIISPILLLIYTLGISSGFIYAKFQRRW